MRRRRVFLGLLLTAFTGGCGLQGELGNGYFRYECTGLADRACESDTLFYDDVPEPLAVGSLVDITFSPSASGSGSHSVVRPASPENISQTPDGLMHIHSEGEHAILAWEDGVVADFIHVQTRDVANLALLRATSAYTERELGDELTVSVGESFEITVVPVDEYGGDLNGGFVLDATSEDDAVIEVRGVVRGQENALRFTAHQTGTAAVWFGMDSGGDPVGVRTLTVTVED